MVGGRARQVDLAARAPLGPIVAGPCPTLRAGLQRPAVEHRRPRLRCPLLKLPQQAAQVMDNRLKDTRPQPALALLIDRGPGRQIMRQHPPLGPRAHQPAQAVADLALRDMPVGAHLPS